MKLSKAATGDVQQNKVFLKILQVSEESLFNKVAVLRACNVIKKMPTQVFSCELCELFTNTYFKKQLQTAGSRAPAQGFFFNNFASLMA